MLYHIKHAYHSNSTHGSHTTYHTLYHAHIIVILIAININNTIAINTMITNSDL